MPFQFVNYAGLPTQGNPALRDFVGNLTKGYQDARVPTQTRLAEDSQREKNFQDLIRSQYLPQEKETGIQLSKAQLEAAKAKAMLDRYNAEQMMAFSQLLSGGDSNNQGSFPIDQGQNAQGISPSVPYRYQAGQGDASQQPMSQTGAEPGSSIMPEYGGKGNQIVLEEGNPNLRHLDQIYQDNPQFRNRFNQFGLKSSTSVHQSPETGQVFFRKTYPSGRIEVTAQELGKGESERTFEKNLAETDAEVYKNASEAVTKSESAADNLNYINDIIKNNRESFYNTVGPVSSWVTKWAGNPQDKALLGNVQSSVGNIVLDAAKSIKGAFTGRDMGLINSIKPNVNEFPEVFEGKMKAMMTINDLVNKRNSLIKQYMRQKYSPDQAIKMARQQTKIEDIKEKVMKQMSGVDDARLFEIKQELAQKRSPKEYSDYYKSLKPFERRMLSRAK